MTIIIVDLIKNTRAYLVDEDDESDIPVIETEKTEDSKVPVAETEKLELTGTVETNQDIEMKSSQ